jgi:hypothetical protein
MDAINAARSGRILTPSVDPNIRRLNFEQHVNIGPVCISLLLLDVMMLMMMMMMRGVRMCVFTESESGRAIIIVILC